MPIHRLAISGYRSLRDIVLGLDRLTVVTGANGSGKSSLYRALRLLAEVAQGRAIPSSPGKGALPRRSGPGRRPSGAGSSTARNGSRARCGAAPSS